MDPLKVLYAQVAALEAQIASIRMTLSLLTGEEVAPELPDIDPEKARPVFGGKKNE